MQNKNILISGGSIAGPALAYWLRRYGCNPTVVERAPALRKGGHGVDFRGTQMDVLRRMGILDDVRRVQTNQGEMVFIDKAGKPLASLPASFAGGEVEILRGDLSRILYEATKDTTEYIFGDWITSLSQTADEVHVTFERGQPRTYDLVVGADGLHSGVRALAFGGESTFRRELGYYIAGFVIPNYLNLRHTSLTYNVPAKGVTVTSQRDNTEAAAGFLFASEPLDYDWHDVEQQKKILADVFTGVGWQTPRLLEAMWDAPELYFDSLSQIHLDHYSKGRVVLLGDAAWCAGPGGSGTGLAMVAAAVLAGELAASGGDHRAAFTRYEEHVRGAATRGLKQGKGSGSFLAPRTPSKIRLRNLMCRMLSSRAMAGVLDRMAMKAANAITLKDYPG